MELRLRNVAKIEYADLKLNGITVIAGENNVGKSTVGKTVFALFNSLVNIEDKIKEQKARKLFKLFREIEKKVDLEGKRSLDDRITLARLRILANSFSSVSTEEDLRESINKISELGSGELGDIIATEFFEEAKKTINLPIDRLKKAAISGYFGRVFYDEINSIYNKSTRAVIDAVIQGKNICLEFEQNNCVNVEQQIGIVNEAVYLDNPFVLNGLNNGITGRDEIEKVIINKLRKNLDAVEDVVQYSLLTDKIQEIVDRISKVTSGSLSSDETYSYSYRENGNDKLNVNNLSAGLKAFVIIKSLLEKGELKERDILILDEPEIHLHPEWQMIYAEVIVLLQKIFNLTIVLTTHSAHFLDALYYYTRLHKIESKCNFYLAKQGEYGSVMEDVTDDISKIYAKLVDPSILLDKLKYQMEEEIDE